MQPEIQRRLEGYARLAFVRAESQNGEEDEGEFPTFKVPTRKTVCLTIGTTEENTDYSG